MTNASLDGSEPLVLDSRELSQLLVIGRTKAYQMMARGEVPVIRIGRCVRVPRAALASWIVERTSPVMVEREFGSAERLRF